jgi:hypothetical protein
MIAIWVVSKSAEEGDTGIEENPVTGAVNIPDNQRISKELKSKIN